MNQQSMQCKIHRIVRQSPRSASREKLLSKTSQTLAMHFDKGEILNASALSDENNMVSEYEVPQSGWPLNVNNFYSVEPRDNPPQEPNQELNHEVSENLTVQNESSCHCSFEPTKEIEVTPEMVEAPRAVANTRLPSQQSNTTIPAGSPVNGNLESSHVSHNDRSNEAQLDQNPIASEDENIIGEETVPEEISDDDIQADIQAILAEARKPKSPASPAARSSAPTNNQQQIESNGLVQPQAEAQKAAPPVPPKKENPHAIFDQLAESMQYANAYDLGTLELEKRFDAFDKTEIKEVKNAQAVEPKQAKTSNQRVADEPSTEEFLDDLDQIHDQHQTSVAQTQEIPLSPVVGGRSIGLTALEAGDVILSTTDQAVSRAIRMATDSEVSHSAIYLGDGQVIEAIDDGVIIRQLETALNDDSLAVAYRHRDMTSDKARQMVDSLKQIARQRLSYDRWGLVRVAPQQLARSMCNLLSGGAREQCLSLARSARMGTDTNDSFYCSELVLEAYRNLDLSITDINPDWSSPDEILDLHYSGALTYVGHLKA